MAQQETQLPATTSICILSDLNWTFKGIGAQVRLSNRIADPELTAAQSAALASWISLESNLSRIENKTRCGEGRRKERQ